jgi:hypothetical protein
MEDKTMKKTYSKPEMQVITIQQQGCLLQASKGGYNRTDIREFYSPNQKDDIRFDFDGFDDDDPDL